MYYIFINVFNLIEARCGAMTENDIYNGFIVPLDTRQECPFHVIITAFSFLDKETIGRDRMRGPGDNSKDKSHSIWTDCACLMQCVHLLSTIKNTI